MDNERRSADPVNRAFEDFIAAKQELAAVNALRDEPSRKVNAAVRAIIDAAFEDAGIERPPLGKCVQLLIAGYLVEIWHRNGEPEFQATISKQPLRAF